MSKTRNKKIDSKRPYKTHKNQTFKRKRGNLEEKYLEKAREDDHQTPRQKLWRPEGSGLVSSNF